MSSLLRSLRPGRRHDRRSRADAPSVFDPAKQEEGRAPFMLQLGDKYSLVYDDGEWTAGVCVCIMCVCVLCVCVCVCGLLR